MSTLIKTTLFLIASFFCICCSKEEEKIEIIPMDEIITPELQKELGLNMPIYNGNTPPNVEGTYLCSPAYLTYSSIPGDEDYYGEEGGFMDFEISYTGQSSVDNKLKGKLQNVQDGESYNLFTSEGDTYIFGSNNNFTIFDPMIKIKDDGKVVKEVFIISGTKTDSGISNIHISLLMVDKPDDAVDIINVDDYRIFTDGDGLATKSVFSSTSKLSKSFSSREKFPNAILPDTQIFYHNN